MTPKKGKEKGQKFKAFTPAELEAARRRPRDLEYPKSNVQKVTCARWPDVCVMDKSVCLFWPAKEVETAGYNRPGAADVRPYVCPYLIVVKAPEFRTATLQVRTQKHAENLAMELTRQSQWFSMTPLPDDEWEFTVKEENLALITKVIEQVPGELK